jgi:hypothetical protein
MRPFGGIRPPFFLFQGFFATADQAGGTLLSLIYRVLKSAVQLSTVQLGEVHFDRYAAKKQEQRSCNWIKTSGQMKQNRSIG